jgi:hypothetical protein
MKQADNRVTEYQFALTTRRPTYACVLEADDQNTLKTEIENYSARKQRSQLTDMICQLLHVQLIGNQFISCRYVDTHVTRITKCR